MATGDVFGIQVARCPPCLRMVEVMAITGSGQSLIGKLERIYRCTKRHRALSKSLAAHYALKGVRVNCICPARSARRSCTARSRTS